MMLKGRKNAVRSMLAASKVLAISKPGVMTVETMSPTEQKNEKEGLVRSNK